MTTRAKDELVDVLDKDKPINGQKFACLSFISPEDLIKRRELFMLEAFVKKWDMINSTRVFSQFMHFVAYKHSLDFNKLNDDLLRLWKDNGWTVVFVTHSVYEAVYLSNRVVVMAARPGRVIDEGPIEAPYPRGQEFRVSTEFAGYCRRVSEALEVASQQGEEAES